MSCCFPERSLTSEVLCPGKQKTKKQKESDALDLETVTILFSQELKCDKNTINIGLRK
jgi:hypothetical protein